MSATENASAATPLERPILLVGEALSERSPEVREALGNGFTHYNLATPGQAYFANARGGGIRKPRPMLVEWVDLASENQAAELARMGTLFGSKLVLTGRSTTGVDRRLVEMCDVRVVK